MNARAKVLGGVPESITLAAYISLFESVGIDPRNTTSLAFRADGIHAEVFALDDNGAKIIDPIEGVIKHSIYIPVEGSK